MGTEVLERQYTADELTSAMDQLHALSMATWRGLLAHVAEYDAAGAWRADGMASMADWLIARSGLERSTAHEWVRTARSGSASAARLAPARSTRASTLAAALTRLAEQTGPDPDDEGPALDRAIAASLDTGVPLAHDTLRRLACDARVQLVGEGPGAEALARTTLEHTVPHWLRRQLTHRDGGCRWRGCQRTRALHAHHLVWFSKGGKTTSSNLVLLCRRHHRAVHEGGWRIEGDPAATLRFLRPSGIPLPEHPPPLAPDRREWLRQHLPDLGAIPRLAFPPG